MLITFLTFAVVVIAILGILLLYIWPNSPTKKSTVPGLQPSDDKLGNIPDISSAGSFHEFLLDLHGKFGDIASFWYAKSFCVSISNASLFKEAQHMFDRPGLLFEFLVDIISKKSIQFANGLEGRQRHKIYSECFAHESCVNLLPQFNQICQEFVVNWESLPRDEHVPLHEYMMALAIRIITGTQFGMHFKKHKSTLEFHDQYERLMNNLEAIFLGEFDRNDKERYRIFQTCLRDFTGKVKLLVREHREARQSGDYEKAPFLDALLDRAGHDDEEVLADAITFVIGGFHTTGNFLTWFFYYLALYPDIQDKIAAELEKELDHSKGLDDSTISKLGYTAQVLHETLRHSIVAPFAARINEERDVSLGGHLIEAGTPIVLSLGAMLRDPNQFKDPEKFDPDNFSAEKVKNRPATGFSPFGIGARKCPGYKFSYYEVYAAVAAIVPKFKVIPAFEEDFEVSMKFGFVTKPESEIWIKLVKR